MGFYSTCEMDLKIQKDKIEKFRKKVADINEEVNHRQDANGKDLAYEGKYGFVSFFLEDMTISDEGDMEWGEYYAKWYDDDKFVRFIAPFVTEGTLIFKGEDGEKWGYEFDGEGKVWLIEWTQKRGQEFFDSNKEE